jgi:hypothetical protein
MPLDNLDLVLTFGSFCAIVKKLEVMRGDISSLLVIISVVDRELFIPDLVPDPTVEKFRIRFRIHIRTRIQNIFSSVKKIGTKFCLFNVGNSIVAQKVLITVVFIFYLEKFILCLRTLSVHFISDPYPNSGPDSEPAPECITDPVPLRQKVPDLVLGPDPQHCFLPSYTSSVLW